MPYILSFPLPAGGHHVTLTAVLPATVLSVIAGI